MAERPAPPPAPSAEGDAENDIAAAATPAVAKAAGGFLLFAGVVVALTGMQLFALVRLSGAFAFAPHAHIGSGIVQGFFGLMVFRGRAWAASAAAVLAGALVLLTGAWLALSFARGVFSLLALGSPLVMLLTLGLAVVSIKPCERATEARARLAAQGMGFGL